MRQTLKDVRILLGRQNRDGISRHENIIAVFHWIPDDVLGYSLPGNSEPLHPAEHDRK